MQTLIDLSESTAEDTRTECPICLIQGPLPDGTTNHVASHLEKLAIFATRGNFSKLNTDLDEGPDSASVTKNYRSSVEMQPEQLKNDDALQPFQPEIISFKMDDNPTEGFNMPSPLSHAMIIEHQLQNISSNVSLPLLQIPQPTILPRSLCLTRPLSFRSTKSYRIQALLSNLTNSSDGYLHLTLVPMFMWTEV